MAYENGLRLLNVSLGGETNIIAQQDLKAVEQDPFRFEAHRLQVQFGEDTEEMALALMERAQGQPYAEPSEEERAVIERRVRDDFIANGSPETRVAYGARLTLKEVVALILPSDRDEVA